MKKGIIFIILTFLISVKIVYAEIVTEIGSPKDFCESVKNDQVKIYIYDYSKNSNVEVGKIDNKCSNTGYYNQNLSNITSGKTYTAWTWHGRINYDYEYYIENEKQHKDLYQYFSISNRGKAYDSNGKLKRLNTLKGGDKIYFKVFLGDDKFSSSKYSDVRVTIDYGSTSVDTKIISRNSMRIYVIASDGKTYGPYEIEHYKKEEVIKVKMSEDKMKDITKYKLVSENLLKSIPNNVQIEEIKVVPYDKYNVHGGSFNIYDFRVEGYNDLYNPGIVKTSVTDVNYLKKNITDNMIDVSTLKWEVNPSNSTEIYYYSYFGTVGPKVYKKGNSPYYGIPYVNAHKSTIESFLDNTSVGKDSKGKDIFMYNFPTKYNATTTSTRNNIITEGTDILNNKLYIYEKSDRDNKECESEVCRKKYLQDYDFIINKNYFYGLDCSSSTYLSEGMELSSVVSMAESNRYSTSLEVIPLGNVKLDVGKMEKWLRDNGRIYKNTQLTSVMITNYYSEYLKATNDSEVIYESYALTLPSDILAVRGHVRMVTGYPHVVCNDNTIIEYKKYTSGACKGHKGINPEKSYVITTEIGGIYSTQASKIVSHNGVSVKREDTFALESETGWSFSINKDHTDITNVDQFLNKKGNFIINNKYSFKDLIDGKKTYMAFRYKKMQELMDTKQIDLPVASVRNASTNYTLKQNKELKGLILTNYLIREVKVVVNERTFTFHPLQTTSFSLYYDTSQEMKDYINGLDNDSIIINVYVKYGPNIDSVKEAAGIVDDYKMVLALDSSSNLVPNDPIVQIDTPEPDDDQEQTDDYDEEIDYDEDDDPDEEVAGEEKTITSPDTGSILSLVFIASLGILLLFLNIKRKKLNHLQRI